MTFTTDVVELTRQLIQIRSINPPGNEEECARWLAAYLNSFEFSTRLLPFGEGRYNLIAEMKGDGAGQLLSFSGHMDTVPLGVAPWSVDPFAGEVRDGRLYGRGSTDMKSGIAAFLVACIESRGAIQKSAGVRLLLTGGEETGCDGARALAQSMPEYLDNVGALIVGEPTQNYPFVGHKGALWLKGLAEGVTAHGSMPEAGVNAVYKAVDAINKLRKFELSHSHLLMGGSTMNVGKIQGGMNVNSVPDQAEFEVDLRTVPGMVHQELKDELAGVLGGDISLFAFVDVPPLASDEMHPWMQRVFQCCAPYVGSIVPRAVPYFTDGSVLSPKSGDLPIVILGPGEPQVMHKTDEYCRVDLLREGVQVYKSVLEDWATPRIGYASSDTDLAQVK